MGAVSGWTIAPETMIATMFRRTFPADSRRFRARAESFREATRSVSQEPVAGPGRVQPFGVERLIEAGVAGYQT